MQTIEPIHAEIEQRRIGVTFGDGSLRWRLARVRLTRQMHQSGWFTRIEAYDSQKSVLEIDDFPTQFLDRTEVATRGYGYWAWRPFILKHWLLRLKPSDVLVFLDSGCELNINEISSARFDYYCQTAIENGICIMQIENRLGDWCKADLIQELAITEAQKDAKLMEPGVMFLSPQPWVMKLVSDWVNLSTAENMHLLDDSPSKIPEDPDFIEHRHDLALLSSLLVQLGKVGIPQETYFPNKWRSEGVKFPCWVVRNSTPFLLEQDRVTSQTLRMARHYWHWLNRNRH